MFGGNCYRHPYGDRRNWVDAESECQRLLAGAHLASIHSQEEMDFVRNNFPKDENFWLGGNDPNQEGSWV